MSDRSFVRNRLLAVFPPEEIGVWRIRGEDPNCDMGGYHHMPDLGTFEGRYRDVVEYAINLPRFFEWGSGGDIQKASKPIVKKIPLGFTTENLKDLIAKREELAKEVAILDEKIANLGLDSE